MLHIEVFRAVWSTLRQRLTDQRVQDHGSVSVEQVIITAGLVTVTVVAIAALIAGVTKYAGKI
ncbi:MAG: hypothetical protein IPJ14_12715 [Kineosporiaceae bacterium]|nr:hypothetical protein [Kineosporiaceae bacterium]